MANRILSDLIGTLRTYFKIATVRLKDSSGVFEARNAGDTAYINAGMHTLEIHGSNATNKVTLTAPAGLGGNVALTLPSDDGTPGQFISTDGNGALSFADSSSNGVLSVDVSFTQATSSPFSIITPPANSYIVGITVIVSSAATGGSPTLCIGVSGTTDRDMTTAEIDLKTAGTYVVSPMTAVGGSPSEISGTLVPDSQSFEGIVILEYSTPA